MSLVKSLVNYSYNNKFIIISSRHSLVLIGWSVLVYRTYCSSSSVMVGRIVHDINEKRLYVTGLLQVLESP